MQFSPGQLRELRYAALLHDFGKVGVREQILVKEKKLYPMHVDVIRLRFVSLQRAADTAFEHARAEHLLRSGTEGYEDRVRELESVRRDTYTRLALAFEAVLKANEPTVLPDQDVPNLGWLTGLTYTELDGSSQSVLEPGEAHALTIRQGNLDEAERREIESHVMHTYRFLQQIPWTRELSGVPEIAFAHHERLNGHGYPRGMAGSQVSVQTRIITIADIYDALTASDRPYKPAVSPERALDILRAEAADGLLDRDLLQTFADSGIYRR
jgi:response regulator RpfG family c-di-GMP phosphodiesterase